MPFISLRKFPSILRLSFYHQRVLHFVKWFATQPSYQLFIKVDGNFHIAKSKVGSLSSTYLITLSLPNTLLLLAPRRITPLHFLLLHFGFFSCPNLYPLPGDLTQLPNFKFDPTLTTSKSIAWTQNCLSGCLFNTSICISLTLYIPTRVPDHSPPQTSTSISGNGHFTLAVTKSKNGALILDSPTCLKILSVLPLKCIQNLTYYHYLQWEHFVSSHNNFLSGLPHSSLFLPLLPYSPFSTDQLSAP